MHMLASCTVVCMYVCSAAILRYIAAKYDLPDHWYPKELKSRARVDEALAWFPGNLRCKGFFYKVRCIVMFENS